MSSWGALDKHDRKKQRDRRTPDRRGRPRRSPRPRTDRSPSRGRKAVTARTIGELREKLQPDRAARKALRRRAALRLAGRIGARFIPGVGVALLAYELWDLVGKDMPPSPKGYDMTGWKLLYGPWTRANTPDYTRNPSSPSPIPGVYVPRTAPLDGQAKIAENYRPTSEISAYRITFHENYLASENIGTKSRIHSGWESLSTSKAQAYNPNRPETPRRPNRWAEPEWSNIPDLSPWAVPPGIPTVQPNPASWRAGKPGVEVSNGPGTAPRPAPAPDPGFIVFPRPGGRPRPAPRPGNPSPSPSPSPTPTPAPPVVIVPAPPSTAPGSTRLPDQLVSFTPRGTNGRQRPPRVKSRRRGTQRGKRGNHKKAELYSALGIPLKIISAATEFQDLMNAAWEALPLNKRPGYYELHYIDKVTGERKSYWKRRWNASLAQRNGAVAANWDSIDLGKFLDALASNHLEDFLYGSLGKMEQGAAKRLGMERGLSFGPWDTEWQKHMPDGPSMSPKVDIFDKAGL